MEGLAVLPDIFPAIFIQRGRTEIWQNDYKDANQFGAALAGTYWGGKYI